MLWRVILWPPPGQSGVVGLEDYQFHRCPRKRKTFEKSIMSEVIGWIDKYLVMLSVLSAYSPSRRKGDEGRPTGYWI